MTTTMMPTMTGMMTAAKQEAMRQYGADDDDGAQDWPATVAARAMRSLKGQAATWWEKRRRMRSGGKGPSHCRHRDGVAPHGPWEWGKGVRAQAEEQEERERGQTNQKGDGRERQRRWC